jgi:hypothetical protein
LTLGLGGFGPLGHVQRGGKTVLRRFVSRPNTIRFPDLKIRSHFVPVGKFGGFCGRLVELCRGFKLALMVFLLFAAGAVFALVASALQCGVLRSKMSVVTH